MLLGECHVAWSRRCSRLEHPFTLCLIVTLSLCLMEANCTAPGTRQLWHESALPWPSCLFYSLGLEHQARDRIGSSTEGHWHGQHGRREKRSREKQPSWYQSIMMVTITPTKSHVLLHNERGTQSQGRGHSWGNGISRRRQGSRGRSTGPLIFSHQEGQGREW